MRLRFVIMLLGAVLFARVARPRAEVITYYVQLVRACDGDKPPEPNSKRVGPRLMKKFQGPLKWNDYWEIGRQEVALQPGQVTSLPLCRRCRVEIDLTDKRHRRVTAFENGKVVAQTSTVIGKGMTLIGGDWDGKSAWFVVIRRDRPMLASN
jgi:hypothetical protein